MHVYAPVTVKTDFYIRILASIFFLLAFGYTLMMIDVLNVYNALGFNIPTVATFIPAGMLITIGVFLCFCTTDNYKPRSKYEC